MHQTFISIKQIDSLARYLVYICDINYIPLPITTLWLQSVFRILGICTAGCSTTAAWLWTSRWKRNTKQKKILKIMGEEGGGQCRTEQSMSRPWGAHVSVFKFQNVPSLKKRKCPRFAFIEIFAECRDELEGWWKELQKCLFTLTHDDYLRWTAFKIVQFYSTNVKDLRGNTSRDNSTIMLARTHQIKQNVWITTYPHDSCTYTRWGVFTGINYIIHIDVKRWVFL